MRLFPAVCSPLLIHLSHFVAGFVAAICLLLKLKGGKYLLDFNFSCVVSCEGAGDPAGDPILVFATCIHKGKDNQPIYAVCIIAIFQQHSQTEIVGGAVMSRVKENKRRLLVHE